ncbi:MAG: dienelactone hydrolase family protein [Verrucomicrobiota bacterium]|nr:dienelactone hydrolase family protein [Verrucomicrobiota bacterium]
MITLLPKHTGFLLTLLVLYLPYLHAAPPAAPVAYDPLSTTETISPATFDFDVNDTSRKRRILLRVLLPAERKASPVIVFSPGLGGTREGYSYLAKHWAARGYVAIILQHQGSDAFNWENRTPVQRANSIRKATNTANFLARIKDVTTVLDQLEHWNKTDTNLAGRMDLNHIGMAGHSFGAVTAQAVSGQTYVRGTMSYTDPRIKCALLLSPAAPQSVSAPKDAFGKVSIPWMIITGTKDTSLISDTSPESRREVYKALPPVGKYELVLKDGEHSAFTDSPLPGDGPRNPNHHRSILALSTAFWDAWLRTDMAARVWLDSSGPSTVLEVGDSWLRK